MLYTALVYTPDKKHHRYLVDFELDVLAEQLRSQVRACGLTDVGQLVAITDGGNGLEEALQRHLADDLTTVLDWYHAAEHLCDFAAVRFGADEESRTHVGGGGEGDSCTSVAARRCWVTCGGGVAGGVEGGGGGGVAEADRVLREQPPSDGLPEVSGEGLGHRQWSDGGGLQDHRRAAEGLGDALGGGRCRDGGCVAGVVRQRRRRSGTASGVKPTRWPHEKSHPSQRRSPGSRTRDAGCESADILNHCWSDGHHVRGYWVVDLVLGRVCDEG